MDAPVDSDERRVRFLETDGVFRTQEDALQPGWHEWETNQDGWQATGLSCATTHLVLQ